MRTSPTPKQIRVRDGVPFQMRENKRLIRVVWREVMQRFHVVGDGWRVDNAGVLCKKKSWKR